MITLKSGYAYSINMTNEFWCRIGTSIEKFTRNFSKLLRKENWLQRNKHEVGHYERMRIPWTLTLEDGQQPAYSATHAVTGLALQGSTCNCLRGRIRGLLPVHPGLRRDVEKAPHHREIEAHVHTVQLAEFIHVELIENPSIPLSQVDYIKTE